MCVCVSVSGVLFSVGVCVAGLLIFFTLRKVILALSEASRGGHVPYRDSTLTKLLKRSLGGSCHTLMIACLSPADAHVEENHSTLAYATRARAITNVPVVNLDPRTAKMRALQVYIYVCMYVCIDR